MKQDTRKRSKQRAKTPRSTAELLCLLATYEAYGTGVEEPGCLHVLAEAGGER